MQSMARYDCKWRWSKIWSARVCPGTWSYIQAPTRKLKRAYDVLSPGWMYDLNYSVSLPDCQQRCTPPNPGQTCKLEWWMYLSLWLPQETAIQCISRTVLPRNRKQYYFAKFLWIQTLSSVETNFQVEILNNKELILLKCYNLGAQLTHRHSSAQKWTISRHGWTGCGDRVLCFLQRAHGVVGHRMPNVKVYRNKLPDR